MAQEFLDKTGLDALWAKLKNTFVSVSTYVLRAQTVDNKIQALEAGASATGNLVNTLNASLQGKLNITDYNTWKSGVTSKLGSLDGDITGVLNRANYINDTLETKINNVIGTASDTGDTVKGLSNRITSVNNNLQSQINSISGSSTDKVNVSDFNAYKLSISQTLGSHQGQITGALQRANYVNDDLQAKIDAIIGTASDTGNTIHGINNRMAYIDNNLQTQIDVINSKVGSSEFNNYKNINNAKISYISDSLYSTDNRVEYLFNQMQLTIDSMAKRISDLENKVYNSSSSDSSDPSQGTTINAVGRVQDDVDNGVYNQIYVDGTKVTGDYTLRYIDEDDVILSNYGEITK